MKTKKPHNRVYAQPKGSREQYGYDAVDDPKKRRQATPTARSEDFELNAAKRRQLIAQANDCMRNFAIARWAVGKHLDFVSRFTFSSQTKTQFDYDLQTLMEEYSNEPTLCDIAARHTLQRMVRMTEASAVVRGDHLLAKLKTGQLQQIESDRIRDNVGMVTEDMVHGVKLDPFGRALSYQVWRRMRAGNYEFERELAADDVLFHAYYPTERSDQVRGIGLITAGLNDFVDAYEWQDLTKATAKLRTAFAMIVTSNALDGLGETTTNDTDPTEPKYEVDMGKGPFKLELDPGEDVKFLYDESPSANTFDFFKSTIGFALKALDIPLSFYDEALTNFFGQRAALMLYLESCKTKRRNLIQNILQPFTRWKILQWVAQGRLRVPPNGDINKVPFAWHPAGVPYWNPTQEINADIQSIGAGLGNWEDIYLERTGRDWFADMRRRKEQTDFLDELGIVLDPKVIQVMQVASDPNQFGNSSPLAALPGGVF